MSTYPLWACSSVRLRVALLILAALSIEGLMRSNLNMAMVCMLNSTILATERSTKLLANGTDSCPLLTMGAAPQRQYSGPLMWSSQERAIIFAMFYFGGLFATLTTEFLNRRLGSKVVVLWGAFVNVIGTFMTPFVSVQMGAIPLALVRFIMGFGQGVLYPCMSVLVAQWFPLTEKSTALAITTTGNQISVIVSMFLTAEICQIPVMGGWPLAFHVYGVVGVIFCMLWQWGVSDSPTDNKHITNEERTYIAEFKHGVAGKHSAPRWSILLRSPLIWSIAMSSFCHNFITVGVVTYLPLYYKTVLNMSLTSNGILSALPFVGQFLSKVLFAAVADEAKKRKWMGNTAITKCCNSMASFGMGICFVILCFCDCSNRITAVAAVFGAMAFVSGYIPGYNTSVVCVAPSQTAAIASFSRFWAQVGSSIAPYMIGALAKTGSLDEWRIVFVTIIFLCLFSGLFFQIFGSASRQDWDVSAIPQTDRTLLSTDRADGSAASSGAYLETKT